MHKIFHFGLTPANLPILTNAFSVGKIYRDFVRVLGHLFCVRLILLLQIVNRTTLARIDLMPLIRCANVLVKNEFSKVEEHAT